MKQLRYPWDIRGSGKKIISELLVRDPRKRLGCPPRPDTDIKNHEYFSKLDWDAVESRSIKPIFVPQPDSDHLGNFDLDYTNKKLTLLHTDKQETDFEKYYDEEFKDFSFYNPDFVR